MIVKKHFENPAILHENTLPDRAYYIPASSCMGDLVEDRERSDRFRSLKGTWSFRYYKSIHDLEEGDIHARIRADEYSFVPVEVPGVWQQYGFDHHQYTNFRYPFPMDPPYVPMENPCGIYVHHFDYDFREEAPRAWLGFEGVDSCFYVWLNGTYLGYSQVSHSTSEWDVSGILRQGSNTLKVLVLKWCDGSYMEDQDKFRMSGIFRDVYLMNRPGAGIYDYKIDTCILEDGSAGIGINAEFYGTGEALSDAAYLVRLYDGDMETCLGETLLTAGPDSSASASLTLPAPRLWNPEYPYLYTLVMSGAGETITERVGIREVTILENVVLLNGRPIKFRGVNRHESDPVTGPVVTMEQMKRDLALIRRHNFNAIRTSHYPDAYVLPALRPVWDHGH